MARPDFIPEHGFGTIARHSFQEVVVPEPIAYGFETWGWAAVFTVLFVVAAVGVLKLVKRYKANQYRRDALALLRMIGPESAQDAAVILKRTAIQAFGRQEVATLDGQRWAEFLNTSCRQCRFEGEFFDTMMYRGTDRLESGAQKQFVHDVETWIRSHDA